MLIIAMTLSVLSCEKDNDDFTEVSAYEDRLHVLVNQYRAAVSDTSETLELNQLVLQFVMVKEAQIHSRNLAKQDPQEVDDPFEGIEDRIQVVKDKLTGTNYGVIISYADADFPADSVVNRWISSENTRQTLLGTYTQSGPGIAKDDQGGMWITHLFLNIPEVVQ